MLLVPPPAPLLLDMPELNPPGWPGSAKMLVLASEKMPLFWPRLKLKRPLESVYPSARTELDEHSRSIVTDSGGSAPSYIITRPVIQIVRGTSGVLVGVGVCVVGRGVGVGVGVGVPLPVPVGVPPPPPPPPVWPPCCA